MNKVADEEVFKRIRPNKTGAGGHSLEIRLPKAVVERVGVDDSTEILVKVDSRKRIILEKCRSLKGEGHGH